MPFWSSKKASDLVCGMEVEERKAPATYDHEGKRYYFCSANCRSSFERDPHKYMVMSAAAASQQMAEKSEPGARHGC